jgi:hypothetical protein
MVGGLTEPDDRVYRDCDLGKSKGGPLDMGEFQSARSNTHSSCHLSDLCYKGMVLKYCDISLTVCSGTCIRGEKIRKKFTLLRQCI